MHYRDKWYVTREAAPMLFGLGVNGQHLFVDRAQEMVVAKFSSHDAAMDEGRILLTMHGVEAIRRHLAAR
jgi:hypothetical protein